MTDANRQGASARTMILPRQYARLSPVQRLRARRRLRSEITELEPEVETVSDRARLARRKRRLERLEALEAVLA